MPNTLLAKGEPKVSNEAVKEALVDAKSNLTTAQQRMKRTVDKKRRTEEYKIGDEVVLSTANLWTYCPNLLPKVKHGGLAPFASRRLYHQLHLDWICRQVGGSIPSSIPVSLNTISAISGWRSS